MVAALLDSSPFSKKIQRQGKFRQLKAAAGVHLSEMDDESGDRTRP